MGRINLPYDNAEEENLSIKNDDANGFVSVTVQEGQGAAKNFELTKLGKYVNYCIIKSGVETIKAVATNIKYVEFDAGNTEIAWTVKDATYNGLVVFSPVNVQRGTTITVKNSAYLKAKMYVGGQTTLTKAKCEGYFGDTQDNFETKYITFE